MPSLRYSGRKAWKSCSNRAERTEAGTGWVENSLKEPRYQPGEPGVLRITVVRNNSGEVTWEIIQLEAMRGVPQPALDIGKSEETPLPSRKELYSALMMRIAKFLLTYHHGNFRHHAEQRLPYCLRRRTRSRYPFFCTHYFPLAVFAIMYAHTS